MTMANRVGKSKSPSKKTEQRLALAALIEEEGFEVTQCVACFSRETTCKMMMGVSRCNGCVRRGKSCDGSGVQLSTLNSINSELHRLKHEENLAQELLQKAHQEASQALSRLSRLRQQRESLRSRGVIMINKGLTSLDQLEELEKQEAETAVASVDWSTMDISWVTNPSLWIGASLDQYPPDPVSNPSYMWQVLYIIINFRA